MKTKFFTMCVVMLSVCTMTKAQIRNLSLGFAPLGYNHVNITLDDEEYKYDYKSYWNANIGYERQFKGVVTLFELGYSKAKFDKHELKGSSEWFDPAQSADLTNMSFMAYAGKTLNAQKRIQLPLYFGLGGDYIHGGPMHNLTFDLGLKARLKFYVTDKIGIYGGATGRLGFGSKKASESSNSSTYYTISTTTWYVDAGIVFAI